MNNNRSNSPNGCYNGRYHPYSSGYCHNPLQPLHVVNDNTRRNRLLNKTEEVIQSYNVFQGEPEHLKQSTLHASHIDYKPLALTSDSSLFCDVMPPLTNNSGQRDDSLMHCNYQAWNKQVHYEYQQGGLQTSKYSVPLVALPDYITNAQGQLVFPEAMPVFFDEALLDLNLSPTDLEILRLPDSSDEIIDSSTMLLQEDQQTSRASSTELKEISPLVTSDQETLQLIKQLKKNPLVINCQDTFSFLKYYMSAGFSMSHEMVAKLSEDVGVNFFGANEDYMQEKFESCMSALLAFPSKDLVFPRKPSKLELVAFVMSKISFPENKTNESAQSAEVVDLVRSLYLKYPIMNKHQMAEFILKVSSKMQPVQREAYKARLVEVIEIARKSCFSEIVLYSPEEIDGECAIKQLTQLFC